MTARDSSEMVRSRVRLPAGMLGMVVLMLLVEFVLCWLDPHLTLLGAGNWRQTSLAARTDAVSADILLFGDSLVKTGIAPAILSERLNLTTYNLALLGAPPSAAYFLFRGAMQAGAKPRAVMIDVLPSLLMAGEPFGALREWAELLGPSEMLELTSNEPRRDLLTMLLLKRYVPSIRYRDDIRKVVLDLFTSHLNQTSISWLALHERQQTKNHGGYIHPPSPFRTAADRYPAGRVSAEETAVYYPEKWWGRPANLVFLEKFFSFAQSKDIPVFLLLPPIHPGIQSRREQLGIEESYLSIVHKIQKRFPTVTVIDGRHSDFDHGLFWDTFHLGREGATALSQSVAEVIELCLIRKPETQRWIFLPKFVEPRAQLAIEDTDQSRIMLRGSESIRR